MDVTKLSKAESDRLGTYWNVWINSIHIYQFGFLLHLLDIRFHIARMALKCLSSQVWQKIPNCPKSASQVPGKTMYVCMSDMKAEEILEFGGNYQERG